MPERCFLALEPLLTLGFWHFRRPARLRPHRGLPDEVDQPLARVFTIALLRPVLLRDDDDDAFLGHPLAGKAHQANRDLVRQ